MNKKFILRNSLSISMLVSFIVIAMALWQRFDTQNKMFSPVTAFSYYMLHWVEESFNCASHTAIVATMSINITLILLMTWLFFTYIKQAHGEEVALISSLIFSVSPAYIFMVTAFTTMPMVICLMLLALILFTHISSIKKEKGKLWKFILFTIFLFISLITIWFLDNITGLFCLIAFFCALLYTEHRIRTIEKGKSWFATSSIIRYSMITIVAIGIMMEVSATKLNTIFMRLTEVRIFASLDGHIGISLILVILVIVGYFMAMYEKKDVFKNIITLFFIITSWIITIIAQTPTFWTTAFYAFIAAMLIKKLYMRSWSIESLKFMTLLMIFCIFLFSCISYADTIKEMTPTQGLLEAKKFIEDIDIEGNIFAAPQDGYILTSPQRLYPSISQAYTPEGNISEEIQEFMRYRVLNQVEPFINKRGVRFIVLPQHLEDNTFWSDGTRRGVLFMMEKSKYFISVHSTQGYDIWLYVPR